MKTEFRYKNKLTTESCFHLHKILDSVAVEINLHPDEPFSHEFLPFDVTIPGCWWPSTRVFSWNVFVLRALEVAGMRLPVQDPGYAKSVLSAGR